MSSDNTESKRIPVTILSGFLGSGKTTLLRYILESHEHKQKVAVIVNDMAEINIDAAVVGGDNGAIVQAKKEVISLANGCICCTLRGDLIREIDRIRKLEQYDYILIESTGIAEPQEVAESFCVDPETEQLAEDESQMLWKVARLDTCVTVLDAREFPRYVKSVERFKDQFNDGMEDHDPDGEGEKSIAHLIVQQVEFANVILVNKIDLVTKEQRENVKKIVSTLNPKAKIIESEYGKVDLKHILNSNSFSMEEAQTSSGWLESLKSGGEAHTPETEEYGISSFVYRARKPFHPNRLADWIRSIFHFSQDWNEGNVQDEDHMLASMKTKFGEILRSKGFCWIAGRDKMQCGWAHSGRLLQIAPILPWCADKPEEEWNAESEEELEEMRKNFEGPYGDRRQALVFIGCNLKKDAISSSLNECLLTNDEMKSHSLTATNCYHDTLPAWLETFEVPGKVFNPILRQNERCKFQVAAGLMLHLSNVALHCPVDVEENESLRSMKLWLDKGEGREKVSRLLATLRPGISEQYSLSVDISSPVPTQEIPDEEEEDDEEMKEEHDDEHEHDHEHGHILDSDIEAIHWLRVELIERNGKRSHSGEPVVLSGNTNDFSGVEVHVMGTIVTDPSHFDDGNEANACSME